MIRVKGGDYICHGVDLFNIRNRNEKRIMKVIPEILEEYPEFQPNSMDIKDIYALALNSLPARYVQVTTIILKEPVTDMQVKDAVRGAVERVMKNPSYSGYAIKVTENRVMHEKEGVRPGVSKEDQA